MRTGSGAGEPDALDVPRVTIERAPLPSRLPNDVRACGVPTDLPLSASRILFVCIALCSQRGRSGG